jgi:DNA-directed RNA polymerase specialized sigma24 family protein
MTNTNKGTRDVVEDARAGNRRAIEEVFRSVHPGACRLVRSLSGDAETAERIVDVSFRHALTVLPRWNPHIDPDHWFAHHALQTVRRMSPPRPDSTADLLATSVPIEKRTPEYIAFVRGIRRLPPQQAEAFILHHGHRLNARLLGVSMDCSTTAAENHLRAADTAMRSLTGEGFDALTRQLREVVVALTPPADQTEQFVSAKVGAWADRRSVMRVAKAIVWAVIAALLATTWAYRDRILKLFGD